MALSAAVVRQIALLARLELSAAEERSFREQLGHILEHFETLAAVETGSVEPTAHVVDIAPAFRDDVVTNPPAPEDLRRNAPARDGDFFRVPKIIE